MHLSKEELQLVNENRFEASFKPGEIIIKQGSPASNALFLSKGLAKIYVEGMKGKELHNEHCQAGKNDNGPGCFH